MPEKPPLTDSQVYDSLHEALLALLDARGETKHGETALKTARHVLFTLQTAILKKIDEAKDRDGV